LLLYLLITLGDIKEQIHFFLVEQIFYQHISVPSELFNLFCCQFGHYSDFARRGFVESVVEVDSCCWRDLINRASRKPPSFAGSLVQPRFTLWIPESRNSRSTLGLNYDKEAKRSSSHDSQLEDDVDARTGS